MYEDNQPIVGETSYVEWHSHALDWFEVHCDYVAARDGYKDRKSSGTFCNLRTQDA